MAANENELVRSPDRQRFGGETIMVYRQITSLLGLQTLPGTGEVLYSAQGMER